MLRPAVLVGVLVQQLLQQLSLQPEVWARQRSLQQARTGVACAKR